MFTNLHWFLTTLPPVHTCPHLPDTHIWNIRFQLLLSSLKDVIKSDFFFTKFKKKKKKKKKNATLSHRPPNLPFYLEPGVVDNKEQTNHNKIKKTPKE